MATTIKSKNWKREGRRELRNRINRSMRWLFAIAPDGRLLTPRKVRGHYGREYVLIHEIDAMGNQRGPMLVRAEKAAALVEPVHASQPRRKAA